MFFKMFRSLKSRLLMTLIIVGLLPLVILLSYSLFLSQKKMTHQIIQEEYERSHVIVRLIESDLDALQREVAFLGKLDVMDDILVEDLDQRIVRLLDQKIGDTNTSLIYRVYNHKQKLLVQVPSRQRDPLDIKLTLLKSAPYIIKNRRLYIATNVSASFDQERDIGTLVLEYDLKNLERYLVKSDHVHSYLLHAETNACVGENLQAPLQLVENRHSFIDDDYVSVYEKMSGILEGWYLVYRVDKDVALGTLYDYVQFILIAVLVIVLLVLLLSHYFSKMMVAPIARFTEVTQEISRRQNYEQRVTFDAYDEVVHLSDAFNSMLETTQGALHALNEENQKRLKRLTQLIEIFNNIATTQSVDSCIDLALKEMANIMATPSLSFTKEEKSETRGLCRDLYVMDFEQERRLFFGRLCLGTYQFTQDYEEDLFDAMVNMTVLQVERILLKERTHSISEAKSSFISSMSHELRTPLNAIMSATQYMLVYDALNDEQVDTVSSIATSAEYLLEMINNILDVAKIEAGKMEVKLESCSVTALVRSSSEMLALLAEEKGLDFVVESDVDENLQVQTDAHYFQQIIVNLLSNAIKFTETGAIKVHLYHESDQAIVSIKDSGVGISPSDMKKLFQEFVQVDNLMQKRHKGSGLGLSLSRKIGKEIGADVVLESKGLGEGAEVKIYITVVSANSQIS